MVKVFDATIRGPQSHLYNLICRICFTFERINSLITFHIDCFTGCLPLIAPLQSSKASRSPMKRLTRKDRSRRRQENASDHNQKDRPHASVPDDTAPSNTCSATCLSTITGPNVLLRRHTLLLEDELDSQPDLNTDAPGPITGLLHKPANSEPHPPAPPSPHGQFHAFLFHFFKPTSCGKLVCTTPAKKKNKKSLSCSLHV